SFFAAAKKVSAAPHRGNTNRPLTIQGKAKARRTLTKQAPSIQKTCPHKLLANLWTSCAQSPQVLDAIAVSSVYSTADNGLQATTLLCDKK
ncbi:MULTISPECIES: hypothetical protein, partial [Paraburkholderia]|uniref:hypothetical protein n=1 Tax=Paraburkholderia TaxID=1822464 RepID=UPI0022504038